jgi:hypothetical protein
VHANLFLLSCGDRACCFCLTLFTIRYELVGFVVFSILMDELERPLCVLLFAVFFVHLVGKTICRSKFMRGAICYHQLSVVVRASRRVIYVRRPGCAGARVWQCSGFGLSVRADFES